MTYKEQVYKMEQEPLDVTSAVKNHEEKSPARHKRCVRYIHSNLLLILTVLAIILGLTVGLVVRPYKLSTDALMWLGFPGEIFMRLLKMLILPLIICSVISGTASLNPKSNGKISALAFLFCVVTNFISCVLGFVYTVLIKPARFIRSAESTVVKTQRLQTQDIFADLLRNLVPDNIVEACFRQVQTQYKEVENGDYLMLSNITNGNDTVKELNTLSKSLGKTNGANILGLVVVCVLIGIAINKSHDRGKAFLQFFTSATEVVLILLRWLLWFTPFGVFSLIAVSMAAIEDVQQTFTQLGLFSLTVFAGVATHQIVIMPLILFLLTRRNPYKFILSLSRAWMLGFAATSTAVAIPEMLHACEVSNKIDKRVSRFVVPFCVTINADGSAIYITVAAIFVATVTGYPTDVSSTMIIIVLTTVAAMAIPSVPSASIVTLVVILTSVHIPAHGIGFLFTVEWFLDRIRTTSNIVSHTSCAAVVFRFCKGDLPAVAVEPHVNEQEESHLMNNITKMDGVVVVK